MQQSDIFFLCFVSFWFVAFVLNYSDQWNNNLRDFINALKKKIGRSQSSEIIEMASCFLFTQNTKGVQFTPLG